jgi:hypothetical protein
MANQKRAMKLGVMSNSRIKIAATAFAMMTGLLCSAANAEISPATQPSPGAVTQLINQLGSDSAQDRDTAQQQLASLGASVAPQLKKAAEENADPEIRSRAAAILSLLKTQEVSQTSLITLHTNHMAAQEALNKIGEQCNAQLTVMGLAIPTAAKPARTVTIDADQKPFWDVMTEVCTQLKVCPALDRSTANSMRLFPAWANWMAQPTHQVVGPYWIGVESLSHTRTVDLAAPQMPRDQFKVRLIVYPEPKLSVTQISEFVIREAADDAGHSLMPVGLRLNAPQAPLRRFGQINHILEFGLIYPDQQAGSKISILRGDFAVLVAQDYRQFQVDDVLGAAKVTNPLPNCDIQAEVTRQGSDFNVDIQFKRQSLGDDQWSALINNTGDVTLQDADGHPLMMTRPFGIHSLNDSAGAGYFKASATFSSGATGDASAANKVPEPKRLLWNFPTSIKAARVAVTFKDLPMP